MVHLGPLVLLVSCAAEGSPSAGESREARRVLIHIQRATRGDWRRRGSARWKSNPSAARPMATRTSVRVTAVYLLSFWRRL